MAAVYYERIDVEGHHYGPSSQQRKNALKEVDKALTNMISLIKVSGIHKPSSWVPLEKAFKIGPCHITESLFNTCNWMQWLYIFISWETGYWVHVEVKAPLPWLLFFIDGIITLLVDLH